MADVDITTIWPHSNGLVRVAYSPDSKYVYTAGNEGFLRCYDSQDLDKELVIEYHEDAITAVSVGNEYVCSADEAGKVALHKIDSKDLVCLLNRTTLPVRDVAFDPESKRVVVVSDELIANVIDVKDPLKIKILSGHKKGLLTASWSPDGTLLTTTSSDGQIRVWDMTESEPNCIQVIDHILPPTEPTATTCTRAVWHPSGQYFVCATRNNELIRISRTTWSKLAEYSNPPTGTTTGIAFSATGAYLVTATEETIYVWDNEKRKVVSQFKHPRPTSGDGADANPIHQVVCDPTPGSRDVVYSDDRGQVMFWKNALPAHSAPTVPSKSTAAAAPAAKAATSAPAARERSAPAARTRSESIDIDALDPDRKSKKKAANVESDDDVDRIDEPWLDDDLGDGFGEEFNEAEAPVAAAKKSSYSFGKRFTYGASDDDEPAQQVFQPGSTQWRERRQYLAFNMLGFVHVVERDDANIITVEYHDRSSRPGTHFTDPHKFTMGALGELGSAYAVAATGDQKSVVHFRPADTWAASEDWTYHLPAGENATTIAIGSMPEEAGTLSIAGSGIVLVGTDKGYLRFLTGSGMQKYLVNLGQEIVAVACVRDSSFVVHRNGSKDGLEYKVFDNDSFEMLQMGALPVRKGLTVSWIGFSDEGIPAMYDSEGVLSLLDRARRPRQGRWVPTLDTKTLARRVGRQETYWPVGVSATQFNALILKGEEKEPHFPTPLLQELELQLPLMRLDDTQGQFEEQWMRESLFLSYRKDGIAADDYTERSRLAQEEVNTDKHLIKIIHTACKAERLSTALDAALLLLQGPSVDASIKLAAFFGLTDLEERLELVKEAREGLTAAELENRRTAKWEHLVDDRTVVNMPRLHAAAASASANQPSWSGSVNPFAAQLSRKRSKKNADVPSSGSKRRQVEERAPSPAGEAGEDSMYYDVDEDEPDSKRMRSSNSDAEDEFVEANDDGDAVEASKQSRNPFAKRPHVMKPDPPASSSPNPFATKKLAGKKSAADLARTSSFFGRVEGAASEGKKKSTAKENVQGSGNGKAAKKGKGGKVETVPGNKKQATLFGTNANFTRTTVKKPESKRSHEASATGSGEDEDAGELVEETQTMEDVIEGTPADAAEDETQVEETPQLDETQVEETLPMVPEAVAA